MTWPELIKQKIESLEKHRAAEVRRLDKRGILFPQHDEQIL